MTSSELRQKYLDFFKARGHIQIPSAPLVSENDSTTLFISAGMQPLVPYLLGQTHPEGKRLVDVQLCLRTDDIDEVGDLIHHTFFEMLGNWSLGDYFKKEAIEWSFEFLTAPEGLNIPKEKLAVSVFAGDENAPFDEESCNLWISLEIPKERIAKLPKKNNWWGPAGQIGPCGPDTEMFVWTGKEKAPQIFDPDDNRWVEIWNNVFMEYNKTAEGKFEKLTQRNVDTGMGLERALAVINGLDDDYKTDLFWPVIQKTEEISGKNYEDNKKDFRILVDHLKASIFLIQTGIKPSNKQQGYILRRLVRRATVKMMEFSINIHKELPKICQIIIDTYKDTPYYKETNSIDIHPIIGSEIEDFMRTIHRGTQLLQAQTAIDGKFIFNLYQSHGFPLEVCLDLLKQWGKLVNEETIKADFQKEYVKHQEISKTASAGMFKGGLVEQSEITTKYHTATHLLHTALRQILGDHVQQKGSNITSERLRFDFSSPSKLTEEQLKQVEDLVNQKIKEDLPVTSEVMDKEAALQSGALGFFTEKYGDKVSVYSIGHPERSHAEGGQVEGLPYSKGPSVDTQGSNPSTLSDRSGSPFSREICGGPHVKNTSELGQFKITKEESAGSGIRRIYAELS